MTKDNISVHPNATIPVDLLSAAKRKEVFKSLRALQTTPSERWEEKGVRLFKPEERLYGVRMPDDLWVLFSVHGKDDLVIEGLVHQDTWDWIRELRQAGAAPK
jgi:hypothetical protein